MSTFSIYAQIYSCFWIGWQQLKCTLSTFGFTVVHLFQIQRNSIFKSSLFYFRIALSLTFFLSPTLNNTTGDDGDDSKSQLPFGDFFFLSLSDTSCYNSVVVQQKFSSELRDRLGGSCRVKYMWSLTLTMVNRPCIIPGIFGRSARPWRWHL